MHIQAHILAHEVLADPSDGGTDGSTWYLSPLPAAITPGMPTGETWTRGCECHGRGITRQPGAGIVLCLGYLGPWADEPKVKVGPDIP